MTRFAWLLWASLLGCGSLHELPPIADPLKLGGYEVRAPDGPGWSVRPDPERRAVEFLSPRDPPWHGAGFMLIRVWPETIPAAETADPDLVARKAFAREEERWAKAEGRRRVTDVEKAEVSIGGKTLRRLKYRVLGESGTPEGEAWLARVERYLYFPPDYARARTHYVFLAADLHVVGVFGESGDGRPIRRVIESFALEEAPPSPEPPPLPRP